MTIEQGLPIQTVQELIAERLAFEAKMLDAASTGEDQEAIVGGVKVVIKDVDHSGRQAFPAGNIESLL